MAEILTKSRARNVFYGGSLFFVAIFVVLTVQSHRYIVNKSTTGMELSDAVVAAVEDALSALSPPIERELLLVCPDCEHPWSSVLDIAAYFWVELEAAARRLIDWLSAAPAASRD